MSLSPRVIDEHIVYPTNDTLRLIALEKEGEIVKYEITGMDFERHPHIGQEDGLAVLNSLTFLFQTGPIPEMDTNGLTNEVLLVMVLDRLRGFQNGPYRCKENACAITHIEEALHWLQQRTLTRMRRGIEDIHNSIFISTIV